MHLINSITVSNPTLLSIYVSASGFSFDAGYTFLDVEDEIKTAISDYIKTIPIGDGSTIKVRYNLILSAILSVPGVVDVSTMTLDSITPPVGIIDIVLANNEVSQTDNNKITLSV